MTNKKIFKDNDINWVVGEFPGEWYTYYQNWSFLSSNKYILVENPH